MLELLRASAPTPPGSRRERQRRRHSVAGPLPKPKPPVVPFGGRRSPPPSIEAGDTQHLARLLCAFECVQQSSQRRRAAPRAVPPELPSGPADPRRRSTSVNPLNVANVLAQPRSVVTKKQLRTHFHNAATNFKIVIRKAILNNQIACKKY